MTIEQRLVKDLGTTDIPELAVWMLKDGTLVNGSYEGHQRDVDHHEIGYYFKPSIHAEPGDSYIYILKFMRRGNIRVGCSESGYYMETRTPPTEGQWKIIQRMYQTACDKLLPFGILRYSKTDKYNESFLQYATYIERYLHYPIEPEILYLDY